MPYTITYEPGVEGASPTEAEELLTAKAIAVNATHAGTCTVAEVRDQAGAVVFRSSTPATFRPVG